LTDSRIIVAAISLVLALPMLAQEPIPLTTEDLLESSNAHYPSIIQALASRREAVAQTLEAEGAFDIVFETGGFSRLSGYYDGSAVETTARQPFRRLGGNLYSGYKLSNGSFPIYEDEYFTNTGGAFRIGALFSLMRDRDIDPNRFALTDAQLNLERAGLDLLLTRIGVQQRTLQAYWRWVAIGQQLGVYEDLLRLAEDRQTSLQEQSSSGAIASIVLTENAQNITRRQTFVTSAERDLATAANALSIFYRDGSGTPIVPTEAQLPESMSLDETDQLPVADDRLAISSALDTRPELALLRNAIEQETNRLALRENELKPRLDLNVEVQQGLGSIAEGGVSRDSTDTVVGVTFSIPLQRRGARGRLQRSLARLDATRAEQQLQEDQIRIEIRNLMVDMRYASELFDLAEQQVEQTELLRAAEVVRFESGASDFFLVNVREEAVADARVTLLSAELETRLARTNYDAATVNLERLGIGDRRPLP